MLLLFKIPSPANKLYPFKAEMFNIVLLLLSFSHGQHVSLGDIQRRGIPVWVGGILEQNRVVRVHLGRKDIIL